MIIMIIAPVTCKIVINVESMWTQTAIQLIFISIAQVTLAKSAIKHKTCLDIFISNCFCFYLVFCFYLQGPRGGVETVLLLTAILHVQRSKQHLSTDPLVEAVCTQTLTPPHRLTQLLGTARNYQRYV